MTTPFKFTDSANQLCYGCYSEEKDHFAIWCADLPEVVHIFDCEEVEDYLDRGIWKRVN